MNNDWSPSSRGAIPLFFYARGTKSSEFNQLQEVSIASQPKISMGFISLYAYDVVLIAENNVY